MKIKNSKLNKGFISDTLSIDLKVVRKGRDVLVGFQIGYGKPLYFLARLVKDGLIWLTKKVKQRYHTI